MTTYAETLIEKKEYKDQIWGKVALPQYLKRAIRSYELSHHCPSLSPHIAPPTPIHGDPFSCDCPAMAELEILEYEMTPFDEAYYECFRFTNPNCVI
jgi:hypothetical protein